MRQLVFSTGGDWPSTTVHENHCQLEGVADLAISIQAGENGWGEPVPGGIRQGGAMTAYIQFEGDFQQHPLWPANVILNTPGGVVEVQNFHPYGDFDHTRVIFNGRDVTENLMNLEFRIAYPHTMTGVISLYHDGCWFTSLDDEIDTYYLF